MVISEFYFSDINRVLRPDKVHLLAELHKLCELRELLRVAAIEHRFNVGLSENKGKASETHFCGW